MGRGITGLVGLAVTLAFAIPIAILGFQLLLGGNTLGGVGFLLVAVLMVAIEEYVTSPTDLPGKVAGGLVGRVVKEPDEDAPTEAEK